MKKLLITVFFSVIWSVAALKAQTINELVDRNFQNHSLFKEKLKNVKGSAFLNEDWTTAKIFKNGQKFIIPSKYDILNQVIWIQQENKELVLNPSSFDKAILGETTLVSIENNIYELLEEGAFSLLLKHEKELKKASSINDSSYGSSDFNTDKLVSRETFFMKTSSGVIELKNKKSLQGISNESGEIIRDLKTNVSKREDLILFTKRLND